MDLKQIVLERSATGLKDTKLGIDAFGNVFPPVLEDKVSLLDSSHATDDESLERRIARRPRAELDVSTTDIESGAEELAHRDVQPRRVDNVDD
jgi:hypothetical protein